ncbi:unnamed protein product, partial [Urochloa humidicola]
LQPRRRSPRARRPRRRPPLSPRPSSRPAPPLHRAPRSRCRRGSSRPRAADRCPPQSSPRRLPATASAPLSCPTRGPLQRPQARADSSSATPGRERGPSRRRQRRPVVTLKTTPPWLTGTRAGLLAPVAALIDGDASSEQQRPDSGFHLHALIPCSRHPLPSLATASRGAGPPPPQVASVRCRRSAHAKVDGVLAASPSLIRVDSRRWEQD